MERYPIYYSAPYRAFNGHTMVAPVYERNDGSTYQISAYAFCVDDCNACNAGEALPDW